MQVRSSTRPRAASAPPRLASEPHNTPTDALNASRTRLRDALQRADGLIDADLLAHLARHAESGGGLLDLTPHHMALQPSTAAARAELNEIMAALSTVCTARGAAPSTLVLPPGLRKLPAWVQHFSATTELRIPHYLGRQLDARGLPGLRRLDLGETVPRHLLLRLPLGCELAVTHPDTRAPMVVNTPRDNHQQIQLKWRPLNFNGRVRRGAGEDKYVCRHLSLEKMRQWAEARLRPLFIEHAPDPMGSLSAIAQNMSPDTEELFAALDHRPRSAHLVAHRQWDDFARRQLEQMRRDGRPVATALMCTRTHVMALRFDITNPDEPHIECWDPNFTDIVTVSRAPFDFQALFHDWERVHEPYFGSEKQAFGPSPHVKVIAIDNPLDPAGSVAPDSARCEVSADFAGLPDAMHPTLARELIAHGISPLSETLLVQAIETLPLTRKQCLDLLLALDDHNYPALQVATTAGHGRAHTCVAQALLAAHRRGLIDEQGVRKVLEGSGTLGKALSVTFKKGPPAVVTDMGRALTLLHREGALSARSVYHLLRAANANRNSTIDQIRDIKVAKALDRTLKRLYRAGALSKEDYRELHAEAKEVMHDLVEAARERKREAKAPTGVPPMVRV